MYLLYDYLLLLARVYVSLHIIYTVCWNTPFVIKSTEWFICRVMEFSHDSHFAFTLSFSGTFILDAPQVQLSVSVLTNHSWL